MLETICAKNNRKHAAYYCKKMGLDPAVLANPFITTISDVVFAACLYRLCCFNSAFIKRFCAVFIRQNSAEILVFDKNLLSCYTLYHTKKRNLLLEA